MDEPGSAPAVALVGPTQRRYTLSEGIRVVTLLEPESVCDGAQARGRARGPRFRRRGAGRPMRPGSCMQACSWPHASSSPPTQVAYRWAATNTATNATWAAVEATRPRLTVAPAAVRLSGVRHGDSHLLQLQAALNGGAFSPVASLTVTAEGSPLVAALRGPSDFRAAATAVISAAGSSDPDGACVVGGARVRDVWCIV